VAVLDELRQPAPARADESDRDHGDRVRRGRDRQGGLDHYAARGTYDLPLLRKIAPPE
jgi:hypothetical protein